MKQKNFTLLENKTIGNNISVYRKIRGLKASDVVERLGIKESSYTRYERGEAFITVVIPQQVARILEVDPLMISITHLSTITKSAINLQEQS